MAKFDICRGKEKNVPGEIKDGFVYMCTDTKNIFMDYLDRSGIGIRIQMNADAANKLRYQIGDSETVELDAFDIANHLTNKENPHGVTGSQLGIYIAEVGEVMSHLGLLA